MSNASRRPRKDVVGKCTRNGVFTCNGGDTCTTGCGTSKCSCKTKFDAGGTCEKYPTDGAPPVDCGDAAVIPQDPVCEPPKCGVVGCSDGPAGCGITCNEICTPFSNCTTTCASGGDCSIRRCDPPR